MSFWKAYVKYEFFFIRKSYVRIMYIGLFCLTGFPYSRGYEKHGSTKFAQKLTQPLKNCEVKNSAAIPTQHSQFLDKLCQFTYYCMCAYHRILSTRNNKETLQHKLWRQ